MPGLRLATRAVSRELTGNRCFRRACALKLAGMKQCAGLWQCLTVVLAVTAWQATVYGESAPGATPVYIEDSPAAVEIVDEAMSLRDQGRLADAAQRLQRVIEQYPHKLMLVSQGQYQDAMIWVRRLLVSDAALLEAYRSKYAATAERELGLALQPRVNAAALEAVVATYELTPAGLDAALLLAGWYLEQAEAGSSASVLDEVADHPDLPASAARYALLQATAGLLAGDSERLTQYRQALKEQDAAAALASLDGLASALVRPSVNDAAQAQGQSLPDLTAPPLWETQVNWTPMGDLVSVRGRPGLRGGEAMSLKPVLAGSTIYVNEGDQLRAIDRSSGWTLWTYQWQGDDEQSANLPAIASMRPSQSPMRSVTVAGNSIFAVLGESSAWPTRWRQQGPVTSLVCVDAQTGSLIWSTDPAALDATLDKAYLVGTPIAGEDQVLTLVRRSQMSGFQDTFVMAVDRRSGKLLWRRHLASAAAAQRYGTASPEPTMVQDGGSVYVCDSVGTIAAIERRTGTVRWLRLLSQGGGLNAALPRPRGKDVEGASQAVLCTAGVIAQCSSLPGSLLLNPRTGETIRSLTGKAWTDVHQLRLLADGDVLAIGGAVVRFDGNTLEERWSQPLEKAAALVGEAAIVPGHVIVPVDEQLLTISLANGQLLSQTPIAEQANITWHDGQLLVTTASHLRSYMTWDKALAQLRTRIEQHPTEPDGGLALAELAIRTERYDMVLSAADEALAALQLQSESAAAPASSAAAQRKVFDHLLVMTDRADRGPAKLRQSLFDRLATITAGPAQEVAYHLRVAAFLADAGEPVQAVDHLQAVLLDATLAGQFYERQPVSRQARLEAEHRLQELAQEQGRQVYAKYETQAAHRLAMLQAQAQANPEVLMNLAQQYPLAYASADALVAAAQAFAAGGDSPAAARQLRRAFDKAQAGAPQARIAGLLATLYIDTGQAARASDWLEHLRQRYPGLQPMQADSPMTVDAWLAVLEQSPSHDLRLPQLALPLEQPALLAGRLLLMADDGARVSEQLLTYADGIVRLYSGQQPSLQWQHKVEADDIQLLSLSDHQVLLRVEHDRDRQLLALDPTTGEAIWGHRIDVDAVLAEAGDPHDREVDQPIEQRQFMQMLENAPVQIRGGRMQVVTREASRRYWVLAGDRTVVLVDHLGRVVGIDRHDGGVLWRMLSPMEQVTHVTLHGDTVALAGEGGLGTDAQMGIILLLDIATGRQRVPQLQGRQAARWIGFAGDETLVVAEDDQIISYRISDGGVNWRLDVPTTNLSSQGWCNERSLVILDQAGVAVVIDTTTGQPKSRIPMNMRGSTSPVTAQAIQTNWHLLAPGQLVTMDADGHIHWRDAIAGDSGRRISQIITRDYVALLTETRKSSRLRRAPNLPGLEAGRNEDERPAAAAFELEAELERGPVPAEPAAEVRTDYWLYLLDRHTGSIIAEHPLASLPTGGFADGRGIVRHNALLYPLAKHTLVIPGAAAAESQAPAN